VIPSNGDFLMEIKHVLKYSFRLPESNLVLLSTRLYFFRVCVLICYILF
jgi:hypothetical protein